MKRFLKSRREMGFTLIEIMIVILIIGILLVIAVPNFILSRDKSQNNACQDNLWKIEGAKEQWALENNKGNGDTPLPATLTALYLKKSATCPAGGTYSPGAVGSFSTCSKRGTHVIP